MKEPTQLPLKAARRRDPSQPIHSKWHEVMQLIKSASRADQWHLHMLQQRTVHEAQTARQGLRAYAAKHGYTIEVWTDEELAYVKARIVDWPKSQAPRPVPVPEVKANPEVVSRALTALQALNDKPAPAAPAARKALRVSLVSPGCEPLEKDLNRMHAEGYEYVTSIDRDKQLLVVYRLRAGV